MKDVVQYLMDNYYAKYDGFRKDVIPTVDELDRALCNYPDRLVVVQDAMRINGVAIYLTLSDNTYNRLKDLDITQIDVIKELLPEDGDNIHFVLLCAGDFSSILKGLKETIKKRNPKTVSWFSPDLKQLHRYKVG